MSDRRFHQGDRIEFQGVVYDVDDYWANTDTYTAYLPADLQHDSPRDLPRADVDRAGMPIDSFNRRPGETE